jgi:hypothetical protein
MGVMTVIVILIVLVPLAILSAWAVGHDLKRRRHHAPAIDVESRVAALEASVQAKGVVSGPDTGGAAF